MAETLQVVITGKDGVSRVFKEISQSADATGRAVEQAGEKGERSFRRVGDSAGKAKVSISDLGAAATALGGVLAYAGNEALKQQQTIIGLQAAFGDAADEYIAFADTIAANSIFNDDDIMRGERYFATLKNNYDLTDQQIRQLMETTADLASAYGVSFEDASSRITSAIRGEGEAAEYLGLTMNQQSIDRENLTLTMSNQEAAQFRLNALYQQTGVYQGTAQKLAESEVGTRARLTNAIQDNAQALGNFIGPIGSMVAGLGFAATGIGQMTGALGKLATGARSSSLAMSAFGLAFNPVTLGLAAVAAAGIYAWNVFQDGKHAVKELDDAMKSLADTAVDLRLSGEDVSAGFVDQFIRDADEVRLASKSFHDSFDETYKNSILYERAVENAAKSGNNVVVEIRNLQDAYSRTNDEMEDFAAAQGRIGAAFQDSRVDHEALNAALVNLRDQYRAAEITLDEYDDGVIAISGNLDQYREDTEEAVRATVDLSTALSLLTGGLDAVAVSQEHVSAVMTTAIDDVVGAVNKGSRAIERSQELQARSAEIAADSMAASWEHAAELQQMYVDNLTQLQEAAGFGDPLSSWNLAGHASELSLLADAASDAATSLETVFRVTVGNTNAIGQQTESIAKWADTLIGAPGVWAEIDDLMAAGLITQRQWNDAQAAQVEIAQSNAEVQNYIREIQVNQAPLIADQTEALENQMEVIAAMPAAQQLVALGWMDSATAGKALELQQLAIAAANRELGKDGEAAFASMVQGAVAADPALKAVLEDMGLISVGADGTVTVNIPEESLSDMDRLTTAIVALADLLDDGELNGSVNMQVLGIDDVREAKADIDDLPAQKDVAVSVTLTEGGPDVGGFFSGILARNGIENAASVPVTFEPDEGAIEALRASLSQEPVTVPVQFDFAGMGGGAVGSAASAAQSALGQVKQQVSVEIDAIDNASPVIGDVITLAGSVDGYATTVAVNATDAASPTIGDVISFLASVDGYTGTTVIDAMDLASPVIGDAVNFLASVDGYTSTMVLDLVDNASATIGSAVSLLASIDGYTATTYMNIVTNRVDGNRHGGIPGYAHGGVVATLAEGNRPELLHFATGGVMPIYQEGIYEVPDNTYVSPANANPGMTPTVVQGGDTYEVHIHGNVYGIDDLAGALESAFVQRRAGFGGVA